jgi:hypothetical protein
MVIKLYKMGDVTRYCEEWNTPTEVTSIWSMLGEKSETREVPLRGGDNPNKVIESEGKQPE